MVSGQPLLLILAADRRELSRVPAIPAQAGVRWSAIGEVGGFRALLAANGPGRENARSAVERIAARHRLAAVVSAGYVGALDPQLTLGAVFLPETVRCLETALEYSVSLPVYPASSPASRGRLLTIDRVAQTGREKADLRRQGANAVDMEASAVAAAAREQRLPFFAVRVVSDRADSDFPLDFNRARRADGTFSRWRIAVQAGLSPSRWRALGALKRDADLASSNLSGFLRQCQFPL